MLNCHWLVCFTLNSYKRCVLNNISFSIWVRHFYRNSWLIHWNKRWYFNYVMTLFRLIVSEGMIDQSHTWNYLDINLLINLSATHKYQNLNFSRFNFEFARSGWCLKCCISKSKILKQKTNWLSWLENNVTFVCNKIPGRWSFNVTLDNPTRKFGLVRNKL